MKALTIRQPYAWAIAAGHKQVENRTRRTHHRGPLAVHVGAQWHPAADADERVETAQRLHRNVLDPLWTANRAVIAVVDLVDCHRASRACCAAWLDPDAARWGDPDTWHWVLASAKPLAAPVPATGRLGLWDIDLPAVTS